MSAQSGWQLQGSGPEAYERYIVPAFMDTWAKASVAQAEIAPGERVLDVACGTGVVAREVAKRLGAAGKITAFDVNAGMLQLARQLALQQGLDAIEWHHSDVTQLPFADASFDVALCQQSLQYFPDRVAGLREIRRVLRPGGRLLASTWRADEHQCFFGPARKVLTSVLGAATTALSAGTALSEREELRSLFDAAGFRTVHVSIEVQMLRYSSLEAFLPGWLSATPIAAAIGALGDGERAQIMTTMSERLANYADDGGLAVPMESHVSIATR